MVRLGGGDGRRDVAQRMWRLGTVPYLNALPLVEGLRDAEAVQIEQDLPSRLAARLRAGELDAALVSSIELFRHPRLSWLAGPAITSDGPVQSILLYLAVPLEHVTRLALDSSSLSAAVLAQVCLRRFVGRPALEFSLAPPELPLEQQRADAVLRIGDPALTTDPGPRRIVDLGALWREHTGLPFVYALWLARPSSGLAALGPLLLAAAQRGLGRRDELARSFAQQQELPYEPCRDYLHNGIGYTLGARELQGLQLFGRLAHGLGLVDSAELPPAGLEDRHT